MRKKQPISFSQKFPNADPLALQLLQRLLAFDPKDRPTAEEVCCYMLDWQHYFLVTFVMFVYSYLSSFGLSTQL